MVSVPLYSSFVCFFGIFTRGKMLSSFGASGLCCVRLLWSVAVDEEQADWTLLASSVPSHRKDDVYSRFSGFPFCIQQHQI